MPLAPVLAIILCAAFIEWWRLRGTGPKLVIREFRTRPDQTGEFLYILGRPAGVVSWLLSQVGMHAQTSFSATDDEISREVAGPSGFQTVYAPLREISCSTCSYYRAFLVLALSMASYLCGFGFLALALFKSNNRRVAMAEISEYLWISAIAGTVFYIWYALSKRVLISVLAHGGFNIGISFKRSVLENVQVELGQAMQAIDLINERLRAFKPGQGENHAG